MTERLSKVAYVVARLRVGSEAYHLLTAHAKWGDWTLVGGHVEPHEEEEWIAAARREADEELFPLRQGRDFEIQPLRGGIPAWGPERSRSAGGIPTRYEAAWFYLTFLREPTACLGALPTKEFLLASERLILSRRQEDITGLLGRLDSSLPDGLSGVPYAWPLVVSPPATLDLRGEDAPLTSKPKGVASR